MERKVYACFTKEQQDIFDGLSDMQRRYVLYRSKGNNMSQSYALAGYNGKNKAQCSYLLENKEHPEIKELISALSGMNKISSLSKADSDLNRRIDTLALQKENQNALNIIENADGETARRIKFYRDIANGKIMSVKVLKFKNKHGEVVSTKEEYYDDVETRMKARKELDRILGLNEIRDVGQLQMGDITINIVDASKKDALADKSNQVELEDRDIVITSVEDKKEEDLKEDLKEDIETMEKGEDSGE